MFAIASLILNLHKVTLTHNISFMRSKYSISIVIPCYNEASTILEVIAAVKAAVEAKEIIVVDDASTDGTTELLQSLKGCTVLRHERNQGKGASLQTGFRAATGDIIVVQDADREYDPTDIAKLINPIVLNRADVVYGSRFVGSEPHRVLYFWHRVGNWGITLLSNMLTNLNLTDMETGYKAFRKTCLDKIQLTEKRFCVEPELTAKLAKLGCRFYEVGIAYNGRSYAEGKKLTCKDAVAAIWAILRHNILN